MTVLRLSAALLLVLAAPLMAQNVPITDADDAMIPRVVPVFDPGSHTSPICALGFTRDKSKLITVGEDSSVQVWSTATGERLDILRLPSYGHEQGYNAKVWDVAAVSPDGQFVAIGGGQKKWYADETDVDRAKLLLINVPQRTVRPVIALEGAVTALSFTPDGEGLAVATNGNPQEIHIYSDVTARPARAVRRRRSVVLADPQAQRSAALLQFSPDGKRLMATSRVSDFVLWDLSGAEPRLQTRLELQGNTKAACWFPDGQRFVRAFSGYNRNPHGLEVRTADGVQEREHIFTNQAPFNRQTDVSSIAFTSPQSILLCSDDGSEGPRQGSTVVRYDLSSGTAERLIQEGSAGAYLALGALSEDRELAAVTVSMGLDAIVYRVKDGTVVARCGAASPIPTVVGWAENDLPAGFAWSEEAKHGRFNADPKDLQFGFDLARMEPVAEIRPSDYGVMRQSLGMWSVNRNAVHTFAIHREAEVMGTFQGGNGVSAITLIPQGSDAPLALWAARQETSNSTSLRLSKSDGALVSRLRPQAVYVRDMAPSPDGRFVIVSTGTHRLCVYTTDGAVYPLVSVARIKGEWVAWSGEGYYAASPGGEKMIGWSVSNGASQLATFHTAEKFAKHFRRPDLLRRAVERGSMQRALKLVESRAPSVEQILPPNAN